MTARNLILSAAGTKSFAGGVAYFAATTSNELYYSPDGYNWVSRGIVSFPLTIERIIYANGNLIVIDARRTYRRSTDGGITFKDGGQAGGGVYTYDTAIDSTGQYAVFGTDYGYACYTTDFGETFNTVSVGANNLYTACYGNGYFLTCSYNTLQGYRASYNNPTSWTTVGSRSFRAGTYSSCDPVTGTFWIGSGNTASGAYSTNNGTSFTTVSYPTTWFNVKAYNGTLVGVGATSTIYKSTNNGTSWTSVTNSGTATHLTQANGVWIVASSSGIYSSTDGSTWTQRVAGNFYACGAGT